MRLLAVSPLVRISAVAVVAALVAACSGGVNTTPVSQPGPSSSASVTTSTTTTTSLPAITSSGTSFSGTIGAASVAVLLSEQIAGSPPNGVPALSQSRSTESKPEATATPTPTPLGYVTISVPTTVTIAAGTSFAFTLAQLTAGVSYYLGVYSNGNWTTPAAGPATVSGTTLTFSGLPSFTLTAGSPTTIALYSVVATASASPSPSPSPSPTPSVAPASITFDINASPTPAAVTVSENGYSGAFTSAISCTENPPSQSPSTLQFVAHVSPTSASGTSAAPDFTITPGNETGTCTASFTDANNATVSIPVLNGSTSLNVFNNSRN